MKKITLIVVVLALVTLACGLQRVTPTPVPPNTQPPAATDMPVLPTQAPAATDLPILPTTPSLPSLPPQGDGILYQDDFSTSNPTGSSKMTPISSANYAMAPWSWALCPP